MRRTIREIASILSVIVGVTACATQRPVLSANEQLKRVGPERAEQDTNECIARADVVMKERRDSSDSNVVTNTATSGVVGAAAGGAGGAIFGNAGRGAAAGAVGGTVASLTSALIGWMFRPKAPDQANQQLIDGCLREKGYEPAGWK